MDDFAGSADQIAKQLVAGGMDPQQAMMMALRMAQSRQQADQSILGGVPTQPPVSDVPPATEILGGDPSRLFQRQPTTMERIKDLPKDVLGAGEALVSMGSLAALAPASMLYALRPGQKTQGDPMEFALRNMYMPRSERGPSHLAGLGEVLESLPQTGPLPELQAFTGVGRGVGRQLAEKGRQAGRAMAPAAANVAEDILRRQGLLMDVTAYHGSPHKFAPTEKNPLGEFNPEKMGTGEGAQAYGHGHYLAEARGVGQDYADVLASPRNRVMDRRGVYIEPSPMGGGKYMLAVNSEVGQPKGVAGDATQLIYTDKEFPNLASAIKFARQKGLLSRDQRQKLTAIGEDRKYVPVTKAADVPEPEYTQFIASDPGYLYTVDVPDKMVDKMLDWDKPLSEQSSAIKKAINDIVQAEELYKGKYAARFLDKTATGGDILGVLNEALGSPKAASSYLKDAGIPGVRYLDQGSRGSGKGTRNFVVFPGEEKDLKILERKKEGGSVNHKAVASARRALEKAMAKGGIAKAVGKAAAKATVKTEQKGLDLERLKTTGIEVPEAGFSKEDKAVLRPLYNQGLIRVEERDGKKILVPGKGAWYEFATPEQRTRLDALQESQGVKDLSLMGPTESLLNSAQASFYDFEIVPGVRNVPIQSLEPLLPGYESAQEMKRIQNLANQIKESKQIEPLFIGVDPTGIPYIMEGQHRIRALKSLGYEDVPARIVVDMDEIEKAAGGMVKMAGGGSVIGKAAAAAAKQARTVLSPAESETNLQKMLAESRIKERLYHGTTATESGKGEEAIRRIKPSKEGSLGAGAYLTPKADFASSYAESTGGNVLPVYAQIKKPLIIEGKGDPMIEALVKLGMDEDKASRMVERAYENKGYIGKEVQLRALSQGYDGLMQYRNGDLAEVVVYNPNAIKSAIGNQGTYDITNPELSKAHGGEVKMGTGGSMLGTVAGRAAAAGKAGAKAAKAAKPTKFEVAQRQAQINAAKPIEEGGLGLRPDNTADERAAAQGYIDYYHGTERLDRLLEKPGLDPKRATSGPMPYGTTTRELASNYAMSKADTSRRAEDLGEVQNYFQVSPKDMGLGFRSPLPVERLWYFLSPEQKQKVMSLAPRVGYENLEDFSGKFTVHPEGVNATLSPSQWDFIMKREAKGNPLTALRQMWYESGQLVDDPSQLAEIYRLAGIDAPISQTNAPWTSAQGVLLGKARVKNPLDTSNVEQVQSLIPKLEEAFKRDRSRTSPQGTDQWDKRTRYTPKQWVDDLKKDIDLGQDSYVWTSIPDKVTNELKRFGFDSIIDKSGKGGGSKEPVVIPFSPEQIRSRFAAFDPMEQQSPDLLKKKGGLSALRK